MKAEWWMMVGICACALAALWAINSRIWTECTNAGMSGFYCFMQGI